MKLLEARQQGGEPERKSYNPVRQNKAERSPSDDPPVSQVVESPRRRQRRMGTVSAAEIADASQEVVMPQAGTHQDETGS